MIDWLTFSVPFTHSEPISDGSIISVNPDGDIEWNTDKRLAVRGSHESNLHVKTDRNSYNPETGLFTQLHLDGNPVKWLQGHNLFGTDDVMGLAIETALKLYTTLALSPTEQDINILKSGSFGLYRVDINYSFALANQSKVLQFIHAMETQAHMRHRGAGIMKGKTLYFGQKSRRWSLKMYSKGHEITSKKKGHQLNRELALLPSLTSWADDKLRIELTLRSLQLKDIKLDTASKWGDNTPLEMFKMYLGALEMSTQQDLTSDALSELPSRLKPVYELWRSGHDLRSSYSSSTFYRHRSALLKYGIDIAVVQPSSKKDLTNVVPFIQVLEAVQVSIVPDWAEGTPLYFEPRYYG
tara:strand:- start:36 stop:1097 length:1062 start_codon:yes stop_codon:yes gene_type:complete